MHLRKISLPIPNPSPIVQTCTVVFRTCQELLVQKKTLGSLGQDSVEYVHVNNPIPKVSGNRISRFDFTATVNLKPTSDPKPMEQIKPNYFGGGNFEARTVKDIIEPAKSISNKVSVRAALDQMQAQATD